MESVKVFAARVRAGEENAAQEVAAAIREGGSWVAAAEILSVNPRTLYKWASEVPAVEKATRELRGLGLGWAAGVPSGKARRGFRPSGEG